MEGNGNDEAEDRAGCLTQRHLFVRALNLFACGDARAAGVSKHIDLPEILGIALELPLAWS
jgi:hypothetical protein